MKIGYNDLLVILQKGKARKIYINLETIIGLLSGDIEEINLSENLKRDEDILIKLQKLIDTIKDKTNDNRLEILKDIVVFPKPETLSKEAQDTILDIFAKEYYSR